MNLLTLLPCSKPDLSDLARKTPMDMDRMPEPFRQMLTYVCSVAVVGNGIESSKVPAKFDEYKMVV